MAPTPVVVRLVSDFLCPWCYIGQQSLETVAAAWSDKFDLHVDFVAYQLNKDIPHGDGLSVMDYFLAKGLSVEETEARMSTSPKEMRASMLYQMGADVGIYFRTDVAARRMVNSAKAHALMAAAAAALDKNTKLRDLAGSIFKAFHIDFANIDSDQVLVELGARVGLSEEFVLSVVSDGAAVEAICEQAAAARAQEEGVPQMSFFNSNGQLTGTLSGAQDDREVLKAMKAAGSSP